VEIKEIIAQAIGMVAMAFNILWYQGKSNRLFQLYSPCGE
jgi:hypothetical protein